MKLIKLSKSIGVKQILRNITLIINRGDKVNIYGEDGSGKTTLIKCLLDLAVRDGGTVSILGYDPLNYRKEILRRTGYIPQNIRLKSRTKLKDIIHLIHTLYTEDYRALEELGLLGFLDKDVRALDDVFLTRLYTYMVLIKKPDLVIIDAIDNKNDGKSIYMLRKYIDSNRATLITTSREPSRILNETRHVLIDKGRLYEVPEGLA